MMEFVAFFSAMFNEYDRHKPEKGESWKTMPLSELEELVEKHLEEASETTWLSLEQVDYTERKALLVDIANLCGMAYLRYEYEEEITYRIKALGEDRS